MPESGTEPLSEAELELIDALQINPRASWVDLGQATGSDPATAARRWQRLTGSGRRGPPSPSASGRCTR